MKKFISIILALAILIAPVTSFASADDYTVGNVLWGYYNCLFTSETGGEYRYASDDILEGIDYTVKTYDYYPKSSAKLLALSEVTNLIGKSEKDVMAFLKTRAVSQINVINDKVNKIYSLNVKQNYWSTVSAEIFFNYTKKTVIGINMIYSNSYYTDQDMGVPYSQYVKNLTKYAVSSKLEELPTSVSLGPDDEEFPCDYAYEEHTFKGPDSKGRLVFGKFFISYDYSSIDVAYSYAIFINEQAMFSVMADYGA